MVRIGSRALFGALVLAMMVALGCGGSEPSGLPPKIVDTPADPPPFNQPLPVVDEDAKPQLNLQQRDVWNEWGEKYPRILSLGRGGSMTIEGTEATNLALQGDFTLELWLRPMGKTQPQILTMKGLTLSMHNSILRVETSAEPLVGPEIRSKEWHHLAIVMEQQQLSVYINGKRAAKKQVEATWTPWGTITLGEANGRLGPYVGEMDNFRLVSGARYKSNFLPSQTFTPADTHFAYDFNGTSRGSDVPATFGADAQLKGTAKLVKGSI